MSTLQPNSARQHFFLLLLIHIGFVFIGIVTTLLGVIMPALSARLYLNDAQSGAFFTVQFAGSLLGTFAAGFMWKRFGFPITLFAGLIVMAAGFSGLAGSIGKVSRCVFC